MPLYVAPGSVIPWGDTDVRPDYDFAHSVTLRVRAGRRRCGRLRRPALDGSIAARAALVRWQPLHGDGQRGGLDAVEPAGRRAAQQRAGCGASLSFEA